MFFSNAFRVDLLKVPNCLRNSLAKFEIDKKLMKRAIRYGLTYGPTMIIENLRFYLYNCFQDKERPTDN